MLFVRLIEGLLIRETNVLLAMDPYCVLLFQKQEFKSAPHFGGGNKPKWGETFTFNLNGMNKLKIEVWSRSLFAHDSLVGRGELDLRRLMLVPGKAVQQFVEIYFESKSAGKILMEVALTSTAVKKKHIFDQKESDKFRTSLPEFPDLRGVNIQTEDSRDTPSGFYNFAKKPHNNIQKPFTPQNPEQAKLTKSFIDQQLTNNMAKMNLNGNNLQNLMANQDKNKARGTAPSNQTPISLHPNQISGTPQNPFQQRPVSPTVNPNNMGNPYGQFSQRHKFNGGYIHQQRNVPQALEAKHTSPQTLEKQKSALQKPEQVSSKKQTNTKQERQNNIMGKDSSPEKQKGTGKTPIKSILTPRKLKREKSNKKVSFDF